MALYDSDFDRIWFHVQLEVLSEYCKESVDTGSGRTVRGHSKSTFAQNFQFLTPLPPFFVPVHFTPHPSTYVRFSELPPPSSSQKMFRDAYDAHFK